MWEVDAGPIELRTPKDGVLLSYTITEDGAERPVYVEISGTALAAAESLPSPWDDDVATEGRTAVERHLLDRARTGKAPPSRIAITSVGETVS